MITNANVNENDSASDDDSKSERVTVGSTLVSLCLFVSLCRLADFFPFLRCQRMFQ